MIVCPTPASPPTAYQVVGTAHHRVWFTFADTGNTWCFTSQQIRAGQAKGFFQRCSYDVPTAAAAAAAEAAAAAAEADASRAGGGPAPPPPRDASDTGMTFDAAFLQETLDPSRWPPEMDAALVAYVVRAAEVRALPP